jgi:hypothetical protein
MGLEPVAVFEPEAGDRFLGFPVQSIAAHASVQFDVLIVGTLERPAGTAKLLRTHGVPDHKVLMVRPDWHATPAAAASSASAPTAAADEEPDGQLS